MNELPGLTQKCHWSSFRISLVDSRTGGLQIVQSVGIKSLMEGKLGSTFIQPKSQLASAISDR